MSLITNKGVVMHFFKLLMGEILVVAMGCLEVASHSVTIYATVDKLI